MGSEADARDELLQKIYYDPKTGYSNTLELYRRAKKKSTSITISYVKAWLAKQATAQVFKGTNAKKTHLSIEAARGTYQIDHTFFPSNTKINNHYKAVFCAIEVGSRWAFVCPMKNTQTRAVLAAFEGLCDATKKHNPVKRIVTDDGVEFGSNALRDWLKEKAIAHRTLHKDYHYYSNSIVERFNLTLKRRLQKYMTANGTKKWIDALDDIVYGYNRSKHSTLAERPKDVFRNPISQLIHRIRTIQNNHNLKAKKAFILNRIRPGSKVRLLRKVDQAFSKKIQRYSKKTYTVSGITKNQTMVQLDGKSRAIRPWEVQAVDEVQTNPFQRVVKSPDVETALSNARKARKEGTTSHKKVNDPVVEEAKKTKKVSQQMVGKHIEVEGGFQGTVKRATKHGLWMETVQDGKRSEMRVKPSDKYVEIASKPKEKVTKTATIIEGMEGILNTKLVLDGETFDVLSSRPESSKYVVLRSSNGGDEVSVLYDKDLTEFKINASIAMFLKRFNWHTDTVAVRTEDGEPYWLGKPMGPAKKADAYMSKTSGGEIPVGWLCMPLQWYNADPKKPLTYSHSKGRHMIDMLHAIRVPNVVLANAGKKDSFTVSANDDKRIKDQLARQKNQQAGVPQAPQ